MRSMVLVLGAFILAVLPPEPTGAQQIPTLDRVEELTRQGLAAEARVLLQEWWSREADGASRTDAQRGLWLRGRLSTDPAQAEIDFRRLVVEYPGGPYSDQALFRLAQAAHAAGDSAAAAGHVEQLAREYPASPVRREAQAWLAMAGPAPEPVAPPAADRTPAPDPPAAEPRPPSVGRGDFTVQLGAFSTVERAGVLLDRVADAGFDGRLVTVPGSDLIRVRVGRFDSAEAANELLWRLRDLDFTAQLARDAQREERVIR